jgi:hypothetical protein
MSAIDSIWHELIGQLDDVPIYRLLETPEKGYGEFGDARKGDILLGGGSGETPALRISMPEALEVYTAHDIGKRIYTEGHRYDNEVQEFWGLNHGYDRINRYKKLGYRPKIDGWIESWLACQILHWVTQREQERYKKYMGTIKLIGARDRRINVVIMSEPDLKWKRMSEDWFAGIRNRSTTDRFTKAEAQEGP